MQGCNTQAQLLTHQILHVYGAEYQTHTDSNSHLHGRHDHDVPCAVCYVTQCSMLHAPCQVTGPSGWTREYYGY